MLAIIQSIFFVILGIVNIYMFAKRKQVYCLFFAAFFIFEPIRTLFLAQYLSRTANIALVLVEGILVIFAVVFSFKDVFSKINSIK